MKPTRRWVCRLPMIAGLSLLITAGCADRSKTAAPAVSQEPAKAAVVAESLPPPAASFQPYVLLDAPAAPRKVVSDRRRSLKLSHVGSKAYLTDVDGRHFEAGRAKNGRIVPVYRDPSTNRAYPLLYDSASDRYYRVLHDQDAERYYRGYVGDPANQVYSSDQNYDTSSSPPSEDVPVVSNYDNGPGYASDSVYRQTVPVIVAVSIDIDAHHRHRDYGRRVEPPFCPVPGPIAIGRPVRIPPRAVGQPIRFVERARPPRYDEYPTSPREPRTFRAIGRPVRIAPIPQQSANNQDPQQPVSTVSARQAPPGDDDRSSPRVRLADDRQAVAPQWLPSPPAPAPAPRQTAPVRQPTAPVGDPRNIGPQAPPQQPRTFRNLQRGDNLPYPQQNQPAPDQTPDSGSHRLFFTPPPNHPIATPLRGPGPVVSDPRAATWQRPPAPVTSTPQNTPPTLRSFGPPQRALPQQPAMPAHFSAPPQVQASRAIAQPVPMRISQPIASVAPASAVAVVRPAQPAAAEPAKEAKPAADKDRTK